MRVRITINGRKLCQKCCDMAEDGYRYCKFHKLAVLKEIKRQYDDQPRTLGRDGTDQIGRPATRTDSLSGCPREALNSIWNPDDA